MAAEHCTIEMENIIGAREVDLLAVQPKSAFDQSVTVVEEDLILSTRMRHSIMSPLAMENAKYNL